MVWHLCHVPQSLFCKLWSKIRGLFQFMLTNILLLVVFLLLPLLLSLWSRLCLDLSTLLKWCCSCQPVVWSLMSVFSLWPLVTQTWELKFHFSTIETSLTPLLSQQHMEPWEASPGESWSMKANIVDGANHLEQFFESFLDFPLSSTPPQLLVWRTFTLLYWSLRVY